VLSVAFVSRFFVLFRSYIKTQLKPRLICVASSTFFTYVSKWMCSFFKAMFLTVNDLWMSKLKKINIPCDSSWILNNSIGMVEAINYLNHSRFEIDKVSPLLL
jgi:hypothetical protein